MKERSPVDHKSRWSSLRLYLCGDEIGAAAEEEDDETVSVRSFQTCAMPPQEAQVPVAQPGDVNVADNNPEEHEDQGDIPEKDSVPTEPVSQEEAAALIQSAFRGFMVRSQFKAQT